MKTLHFYSQNETVTNSLSWLLTSYEYKVKHYQELSSLQKILQQHQQAIVIIDVDPHVQITDLLKTNHDVFLLNNANHEIDHEQLPANVRLITTHHVGKPLIKMLEKLA